MKRRRRILEELDRDLAEHIETETQDNIARGMDAEEAHYAALRKFGNIARVKEETREVWVLLWFEHLIQDLRHGARLLGKSAGLTAAVVPILALGIGANAAVFSLVNTMLLKPLAYDHPEQLVQVWRRHGQGWIGSVSIPDLSDWQRQNTAFQGIAAYGSRRFSLQNGSGPQAVEAARVSPNFFDVMQATPAQGRGFTADEGSVGREHVVIVSHDLWASQFGNDPGLVGRTVQLNDDSYTVVGIAPEGFHFPQPETELWVPLAPVGPEIKRDAHDFLAIGRLRPGVALRQAVAQLDTISSRMAKDHPEDEDLGAILIPLKTALVGSLRNGLLIAFVVVGFILLIACANVATLLLSRAATRRREIAVRLALGATRKRLLAQFFAEGMLLASLAAAVALAASHWTVSALVAAGRTYFSLINPIIIIDSRVAGFTVGISALAALLVSLVVGWNSMRLGVAEALKENAANVAGGRSRMRAQRTLVAVQMACAFLLLVGAGALIESFVHLSHISLGFDAHRVLAMRLPISSKRYSAQHPVSLLLGPALARVEALPGARAAGVITYLPMQGYGTTSDFRFSAAPAPQEKTQWAEVRAVSPGYYRALGIRLLRGRLITDSDSHGAPGVALVNEAFVHRYSPAEDVVGRQIFMVDEPRWLTIVGVVEDVHQADRTQPSRPELDLPYTQSTWPYLTATMTLAVRTDGDPAAMAKSVQQAIRAVDRAQPVYNVTTMEQILADTEGDRRFALWLLGISSLLALVLAATGLFAQLSYAVAERTHEIGVRLALGARYRDVVGMVLRQGAAVAGAGIAMGWLLSLALLNVIRALLFGISPAQPAIAAGAAMTLLSIVAVASYLPARRAAKLDPLLALRRE
jgi:predicted permease